MIFTAILISLSILNFVLMLYVLAKTNEVVIRMYPDKVGRFVRRNLCWSLGFALWAAYRIWG